MVRKILALAASFAVVASGNVHAVVFFSSDSPTKNITAPGGPLAGSGWQFQGQWGSTLGTPIAPNYFITASHIGGTVGDSFVFSGSSYTTTAVFDDPNSDLRIWQVDGVFSTYAPLYTGSSEVGQDVVFFGRGSQRGAEVVLSGTSKGWQWGTGDEVQRWGQNKVEAIADGGAPYGTSLLAMAFNDDGGPEEATYSFGDSGGGVFILDAGTWKLAGVNSWADGPYGTEAVRPPEPQTFLGSLYDQDGFYGDTLTGWKQVTGPGMVYASRISTSQAWILSVIPEPATGSLVYAGLFVFGRRRMLNRRR